MDSVGPGTVLAGRYHVQERVHQAVWSSIWRALDDTLERTVSLRVVDAGHPRGEDVVDAARRAAGVEDPRLQRILDVGTEEGVTYVVSEWVSADSLTAMLRSGALPPDEVRRLVGESATALEAARHRGLHHLALTPDCLLRGHDGPVTLTGLAVDAALAGTEVRDPDQASRLDARALVALIYVGLTGRWPLDPVPGLEPPPRVGSALPAPSELTAGVPADLDALCRETLRDGGGPGDPGRLATLLAPWPSGPVMGPNRTMGAFPIHLAGDTAAPTALMPAVGAGSAGSAGSAASVQAAVNVPRPAAPPAPPARPPTTHLPPRPPDPEPPQAPETPTAGAEPPRDGNVGNVGNGPAGAATWPPLPVIRAAAGSPPELPGVPAAVPTPAPAPTPARSPAPAFGGQGPVLDAESPAPLVPATSTARPPAEQTRAVLAVVGVFVLVLCVLAYCGLRSIGGPSHPSSSPTSPSGPTRTGTPTASASTSASGAGAALKIKAAKGFDPQGDGQENDSQGKLAYDAKTSSGWTSDTYRTPKWGGLKKGLGLRLDLGSAQTVHSATIRIGGSGASIELLAVTGSTLTGSTVLATASPAAGTVTLTVTKPTSTRYVVIWFTVPGKFSGGYRAEVDDVRLR